VGPHGRVGKLAFLWKKGFDILIICHTQHHIDAIVKEDNSVLPYWYALLS